MLKKIIEITNTIFVIIATNTFPFIFFHYSGIVNSIVRILIYDILLITSIYNNVKQNKIYWQKIKKRAK